ncbi:MAG TPA: ABC transporter ATP-binding protein, partial [Aestuariivirga sp.]|nr:ABC transporter ATP-binding protein [Aestuariivirga sp.]
AALRDAVLVTYMASEGAPTPFPLSRHIIETCADRLWLVNDGTVRPYDGDMDDYTALVLSKARSAQRRDRTERAEAEAPPAPAKRKTSPAQLRKMIQETEAGIDKIKEKLGVLDQALSDHTIYAEEPLKAADFTRLRARLVSDLESAETRWLELHDEDSHG